MTWVQAFALGIALAAVIGVATADLRRDMASGTISREEARNRGRPRLWFLLLGYLTIVSLLAVPKVGWATTAIGRITVMLVAVLVLGIYSRRAK